MLFSLFMVIRYSTFTDAVVGLPHVIPLGGYCASLSDANYNGLDLWKFVLNNLHSSFLHIGENDTDCTLIF